MLCPTPSPSISLTSSPTTVSWLPHPITLASLLSPSTPWTRPSHLPSLQPGWLSLPWFPHLQNKNNSHRICLTELMWALNVLIHGKCLEKCLAYINHYLSDNLLNNLAHYLLPGLFQFLLILYKTLSCSQIVLFLIQFILYCCILNVTARLRMRSFFLCLFACF